MDVLSWSRHHRLFPGEGSFDLADVRRPRASTPATRARCRWRSSTTRSGRPTCCAPRSRPSGRSPGWRTRWRGCRAGRVAPTRRAAARGRPADRLRLRRGQGRGHRRRRRAAAPARASPSAAGTAPSRCGCGRRAAPGWSATSSRPATGRRRWPRSASRSPTRRPPRERARALDAPAVFRRTHAPDEQELPAFRAPDGTEVFLADRRRRRRRLGAEFEGGEAPPARPAAHRHRPRQPRPPVADASTRRCCSTAACSPWSPGTSQDVAAPTGLVRSQVVRSRRRRGPAGAQRRAAGARPPGTGSRSTWPSRPTDALARGAGGAGARAAPAADPGQLLRRPARPLRPRRRAWSRRCSELGVLYDRDGDGEFTHFYTATVGGVFFEVVQRRRRLRGLRRDQRLGAARGPARARPAGHRRLSRAGQTCAEMNDAMAVTYPVRHSHRVVACGCGSTLSRARSRARDGPAAVHRTTRGRPDDGAALVAALPVTASGGAVRIGRTLAVDAVVLLGHERDHPGSGAAGRPVRSEVFVPVRTSAETRRHGLAGCPPL